MPGPSLLSSMSQQNSAKAPTPSRSPAPSGHIPLKPDYSSSSAFSAFGSNQPSSKSSTPQPSLFQQQQAAAASKQAQAQPQSSDPFASIIAPVRQSTPQQPPQQKSMFDFSAFTPKPQEQQAPAPTATDDDEWAFESALPDSGPASNTILVSQTSLSISMHAAREPSSPDIITLSITFSNSTDVAISELTFMAAVTKVNNILTLSLPWY